MKRYKKIRKENKEKTKFWGTVILTFLISTGFGFMPFAFYNLFKYDDYLFIIMYGPWLIILVILEFLYYFILSNDIIYEEIKK